MANLVSTHATSIGILNIRDASVCAATTNAVGTAIIAAIINAVSGIASSAVDVSAAGIGALLVVAFSVVAA